MGIGTQRPEWDLESERLAALLPGRPCQSFPALLSTEAAALAWAREGAPAGAVVVGDYQVSARGRDGHAWEVPLGESVGFSLVLRPRLPFGYDGLLYVAATVGLLRVAPGDALVHWPDRVAAPSGWDGRVVVQTEPDAGPLGWAVVSVLVRPASPPRTGTLAAAVQAVEEATEQAPRQLLEVFASRAATLGRRVRVRLAPLGPNAPQIVGRSSACRDNGGLVVDTDDGRRAVIPPHELGTIEYLDEPARLSS